MTLYPSVISALKARPPREFRVDDFESLYRKGTREQRIELEEQVFAMLKSWGLERGGDEHQKRNYIGQFVTPLKLLESKFDKFQKLAGEKSDAMFREMWAIRDAMVWVGGWNGNKSDRDSDGDFIIKELKDIKGAVELQVREKAARMLECAPPSDAFRQAIDTCVLVPLVQTVAEQLHAKFQDKLC